MPPTKSCAFAGALPEPLAIQEILLMNEVLTERLIRN